MWELVDSTFCAADGVSVAAFDSRLPKAEPKTRQGRVKILFYYIYELLLAVTELKDFARLSIALSRA